MNWQLIIFCLWSAWFFSVLIVMDGYNKTLFGFIGIAVFIFTLFGAYQIRKNELIERDLENMEG